jgi:hypothetical protein
VGEGRSRGAMGGRWEVKEAREGRSEGGKGTRGWWVGGGGGWGRGRARGRWGG